MQPSLNSIIDRIYRTTGTKKTRWARVSHNHFLLWAMHVGDEMWCGRDMLAKIARPAPATLVSTT
jgi:hypothetical protein